MATAEKQRAAEEVPDEAARSALFGKPKTTGAKPGTVNTNGAVSPNTNAPESPVVQTPTFPGFKINPPQRNVLGRLGADFLAKAKLTTQTASPRKTAATSTDASQRFDADASNDPTKTDSAAPVDMFLSDEEDNEPTEEDIEKTLDAVLLDIGPALAKEDPIDDVDDRLMQFQEDPLVKEALRREVNLRDYGKTIEKELAAVERASVEDYINQSPYISDLHAQIQMCDQILETMETLLTGFQEDLGSISAEIQTLQTQSASMNVKLRNRKTVQAFLGNFLDEILIAPELITHIVEDEVNESYLQHLTTLSRKIAFVKEREGRTVPAIEAIHPELERLRLKATEKVREFLLEKIRALKKQKSNPNVMQKQLLNLRQFNAFLLEQHSATAHEIHDNYVQIMNNFYQRYFVRYCSVLTKMQVIVADKYDLIGAGDTVNKGLFGGRVSMKERMNVYKLGDRAATLTNIDAPILVPHVVEANNQKFTFEVLFRSIERTLMDNASSEYTFITEFFTVRGESTNAIFFAIFEPSLMAIIGVTKQFVEDCYDAVGILLCIRINNAHQRLMQQRRIPAIDPHMNQTTIALWPRFQQIMDLHVRSVKTATIQTIGPLDTQAHYVTRRYADLLTSILCLNEGFNDQPVIISLSRLRGEMESLFLRFAADFTDRRNYLIYYVNQYDIILTTLKDAPSPKAVEAEIEYWTQLLNKSTVGYVEEELSPAFGSLIQFVKQSDSITDFSDVEVGTLEKIAVNFSMHWKQAISNINTRVLTSFVNQKNAANVLQVLLRQLLFYYSKFIDLIEKKFGRSSRLPFREELVGLENVKFEIKKLLPNVS